MTGVALSLLVTLSGASAPAAAPAPVQAPAEAGILLSGSDPAARSASLLGGVELDASWRPSEVQPLRLTDGLRLALAETPAPLDRGAGMSRDLRSVLALILGFVPGFGLGHLIAKDRDGFILFLIIDIALYVLWGTVGWIIQGPGWGVGGLVWLIVHIIQALDAYGEASGERIVQQLREKAVDFAFRGGGGTPPRGPLEAPVVTTRAFGFAF